MSWKWAIDCRSGRLQVDKRALSGAIAGGVALSVLARALLPGTWYYVVVAVLVVPGIALDVWIRKRDPGDPDAESERSRA